MSSSAPRNADAIELHLPDGGHLIVSIEDAATRHSPDCDQLIGTLLRADGGEHEVERAIVETASGLGLVCIPSTEHHPTTVSIRRA
ncbi:MAG: hypothetical protein QOF49_951 [Chloroflexota bacterium]|jgi:hypothetical protein|nr:hypothetical protein [Chloroflexota bacterium]